MVLLAKIGLGFAATMAAAGVYTFHQGLIRVDVDEYRDGGAHVHTWVPAALVPAALHFVPKHNLQRATYRANAWMPMMRTLLKELEKYPNADLIDVQDGDTHAQIRTLNGKLQIDVSEPRENVHVLCPLVTLRGVATQLQESSPTI